MGNIISDIIGLIASIFTIVAFFKLEITTYIPFLNPILNSNYFLGSAISLIFLLCILFFLRGISIDVNYILSEESNRLDLSMGRIRSQFGDSLNLIIQKENECTKYDKILSFLKCKLLVIIEYPKGIKINSEGLSSEFTKLTPSASELTLMGDLDLLKGRRRIELYIESEQDTSYRGNSPILVRVFIAPKYNHIRKLLLTILNSHGFSKINILSDV